MMLFAGCGSSGAASSANGAKGKSKPIDVKFFLAGASLTYLPIWVGIDQGFYKKQGLNVEPITATGSSGTTAAGFASGAFNATFQTIPATAQLIEQGGVNMAISAPYIYGNRLIVAKASDKSIPQAGVNGATWQDVLHALKGKTVGVVGGLIQSDFVGLLHLANMNENEMTIIAISPGGPQVAALQQGQVDAIVTTASTAEAAVAAGGVYSLDMLKYGPPISKGSLVTTMSFTKALLKNSPNAAARFQRAATATIKYMNKPSSMPTMVSLAHQYNFPGTDQELTSEIKQALPTFKATAPAKDIQAGINWAVKTQYVNKPIAVNKLVAH